MFEFLGEISSKESQSADLLDLGDLQLALIGGGNGAASLD